jgi:hypothetical protein
LTSATTTRRPRLTTCLTALFCISLLLTGCARVAGPEQEDTGVGIIPKDPVPSTSTDTIPWDGSEAGNADTRPAAAPCRSKDVRVQVAWRQPDSSAVVGVLSVRNQGTEPCQLAMTPAVKLIGDGVELGTNAPAPPRTAIGGASELVLKPSGTAEADLWWSDWCEQAPERVAVELQPSKGAAPLRSEPAKIIPPPCTDRAGSILEAKQFKLPEAGSGVLYADATTLKIHLLLPDTARSGEALNYRVVLSNPGRWTVRLEPCPNFRDEMQLPNASGELAEQGWTSTSKTWFRLNCASLGGRLAPGASATFEMITQIPEGTADGYALLRWWLEANKRPIKEEAQILIQS